MLIDKKSKVYVAGHKGLVGSSIVRKLREKRQIGSSSGNQTQKQ